MWVGSRHYLVKRSGVQAFSGKKSQLSAALRCESEGCSRPPVRRAPDDVSGSIGCCPGAFTPRLIERDDLPDGFSLGEPVEAFVDLVEAQTVGKQTVDRKQAGAIQGDETRQVAGGDR